MHAWMLKYSACFCQHEARNCRSVVPTRRLRAAFANINHGVRAARPPGADPALPRTGWTATADSENQYPLHLAAFVLDGAQETLWHTDFSSGEPTQLPQRLTIDFGGAVHTVTGMAVQPRADGSNGNIGKYEIHASTDGETFERVTAGEWEDDSEEKARLP